MYRWIHKTVEHTYVNMYTHTNICMYMYIRIYTQESVSTHTPYLHLDIFDISLRVSVSTHTLLESNPLKSDPLESVFLGPSRSLNHLFVELKFVNYYQ